METPWYTTPESIRLTREGRVKFIGNGLFTTPDCKYRIVRNKESGVWVAFGDGRSHNHPSLGVVLDRLKG